MFKKSIALGLVLLAASIPASAVDGYKDAKFGTNIESVKKAKLCNWKKYTGGGRKGVDTYYCEDFSFAGQDSLAFAYFINGSFERLSITINSDLDITALVESLKKKYGAPSSLPNAEEVASAQKNGGSLNMKFDNDTIIVGVSRDANTMVETSLLIYSSSDYFNLLKKLDSKNIEGDL